MPLPLLPILVVAAAGGSALAIHKRRKTVTPARQKIYDQAMNTVKEPAKLLELSKAYQKQGLTEHAADLAKRAKLRSLPPEVKAKRRLIFKNGMKLTDPAKVKTLAAAFQREGATGASAALSKYAAGLVRPTGGGFSAMIQKAKQAQKK